MFDIGFSELIVIGLVALVVIGPEKLPRVARTVGHLLGRMQRHVAEVKADINREIQLDDMRRLQGEVVDAAREVESSIRNHVREFETATAPVVESLDLHRAVEPAEAPAQQPGPVPAASMLQASVPATPMPASPEPPGTEPDGAPGAEAPQLDLFGTAAAPAPAEKP